MNRSNSRLKRFENYQLRTNTNCLASLLSVSNIHFPSPGVESADFRAFEAFSISWLKSPPLARVVTAPPNLPFPPRFCFYFLPLVLILSKARLQHRAKLIDCQSLYAHECTNFRHRGDCQKIIIKTIAFFYHYNYRKIYCQDI